MVGFPSGITRCQRLPGRVSGLAIATGLLVAACAPAQTTSTGAPTAHGTATPSSSASPPPRTSTADCTTTCYTPQQLEAAYGVQPLLRRGIDGRGETVVLPELAETQPNPPVVTDLRQDFAAKGETATTRRVQTEGGFSVKDQFTLFPGKGFESITLTCVNNGAKPGGRVVEVAKLQKLVKEQGFGAAVIEDERVAPLEPRDRLALARFFRQQVADGFLFQGLRSREADIDLLGVRRSYEATAEDPI